ncbi:hypothetical protein EOD39_7066 [Acipenser ruthenus]|uniref:DUF4371 domain-containing protein n=1 Tax=Acipenser ruthenus TaxID=7906 RepID=A0A662YZ51_ACIRT|nr:hypothetical protein EOD39_7066 [Acipenser ruthenus]
MSKRCVSPIRGAKMMKYFQIGQRSLCIHESDKGISSFLCTRYNMTLSCAAGDLAPSLDDNISEKCRTQPFGLMCDESNDQGDDKDFVILARLYDEKEMAVKTQFLDMPTCNIGTGESLFRCLDESCRSVFFETTKKMLNTFPIGKDLVILSPRGRGSIPTQSVICMAKQFPHIVEEHELGRVH